MKRLLSTVLVCLLGVAVMIPQHSLAQTGNAALRWTTGTSKIEVSIFVKRTGTTAWKMGFATFAFKFNKAALAFDSLMTPGIFDVQTSTAYGALISASNQDSTIRSFDIDFAGTAGQGTEVSTIVTRVGTIRFVVKDAGQPLGLAWDSVFTTIYDDAGTNVTGGISFVLDGTVDVPAASQLPTEFALQQNYPNPFNPSTTITFSLPVESRVNLEVYNILGERVTTLVNNPMVAGNHQVRFNASSLASGFYVYRLTVNDGERTFFRKMMLLK